MQTMILCIAVLAGPLVPVPGCTQPPAAAHGKGAKASTKPGFATSLVGWAKPERTREVETVTLGVFAMNGKARGLRVSWVIVTHVPPVYAPPGRTVPWRFNWRPDKKPFRDTTWKTQRGTTVTYSISPEPALAGPGVETSSSFDGGANGRLMVLLQKTLVEIDQKGCPIRRWFLNSFANEALDKIVAREGEKKGGEKGGE